MTRRDRKAEADMLLLVFDTENKPVVTTPPLLNTNMHTQVYSPLASSSTRMSGCANAKPRNPDRTDIKKNRQNN